MELKFIDLTGNKEGAGSSDERRVFLDSGAHSLYGEEILRKGRGYEWFETDAFWEYVDRYALFVKEHSEYFSAYVNVDVIFRPDLTWKVQKYLEDEWNLKPLPVFHYGEDLKWLKKYMDRCEYIGIGGLGQKVSRRAFVEFGDSVFKLLCGGDISKPPEWRTHGFALTATELVSRYPWYSVDSNTWCLVAAYGGIFVPKKQLRNGLYIFDGAHALVTLSLVSAVSSKSNNYNRALIGLSEPERKYVLDYISAMGFDVGKSELKAVPMDYELADDREQFRKSNTERTRLVEVILEPGVSNDPYLRGELNLVYYKNFNSYLNGLPYSKRIRQFHRLPKLISGSKKCCTDTDLSDSTAPLVLYYSCSSRIHMQRIVKQACFPLVSYYNLTDSFVADIKNYVGHVE